MGQIEEDDGLAVERLERSGSASTAETPGEVDAPSPQKVESLTRRFVLKILAALGVGELAHHITSGALPGPSSVIGALLKPGEAVAQEPLSPEEESLVDHAADDLAAEAQRQMEEGKDIQEAILFAIDAFGTANFMLGVRDLLPKGIGNVNIPGEPVGHINSTRYAVMAGLSVLKYVASDEVGKRHLEHETLASMKAFGIIAGTIVVAEGLQLDLKEAYEGATSGKAPSPRDQVAIMTMLGSLVSPVATTVGSASLIRTMSNDLAKTGKMVDEVDHGVAAVAVSHISNLSGYLLFGDPPFIAVCEKLGFQEGVLWQMKTMWPLALSSFLSSTVKLNYLLAQREGRGGAAGWKQAVEDSFAGVLQNLPILAAIIAKSLGNAAKYFTAADVKWAQDPGGIQVKIGEVMLEKIQGMRDLFLNEAPPKHMHEEAKEGLVHNGSEAQHVVDEVIGRILQGAIRPVGPLLGHPAEGDIEDAPTEDAPSPQQALSAAIDRKDFEEVLRLGREMGIPQIELLVDQWKEYQDNPPPEGSEKPDAGSSHARFHQGAWTHLNPQAIYRRATNVDRVKGYLGHNMGDVVNVFPFQAGSVPFLTPMFQRAVEGLEALGLPETVKEMTIFFALMLFSMMADNYVACKIGLELLPNKPQIALIAAVQGGSMTAIGNMANVAQFKLEDYPLAASLGKMLWHADQVAIGLAWSQALGVINGLGVWVPPTAKTSVAEGHARVERQTDTTRRGFLGLFTGGSDTEGPTSKAA